MNPTSLSAMLSQLHQAELLAEAEQARQISALQQTRQVSNIRQLFHNLLNRKPAAQEYPTTELDIGAAS